MAEARPNTELMSSISSGVASFVAGSFMILTVIQLPEKTINLDAIRVSGWAIGLVFIVNAFWCLIGVFKDNFRDTNRRWQSRILPSLYGLSLVEILVNGFSAFKVGDTLLFIITLLFLLVVTIATGNVLKNTHILLEPFTLLLAAVSFNTMVVILMLLGSEKWPVIIYSIIGLSLLIVGMTRRPTRG